MEREMKERELMEVIPAWERKCRWMEIGIVSYKLCTRNYECSSCPLEQALIEDQRNPIYFTRVKSPEWFSSAHREKFLSLPPESRKCRHMLTGEVSFRLCDNSFRCSSCEFHQSLLDRTSAEFPLIEEDVSWVAGYQVPLHLYFYRGHSWARLECNGIVRVGIDDFAAKLMGKVEAVELPKIGEQILQGAPASELKQNGLKARVRSPMDGVVVAVNPALTNPKNTLRDPYGKDWMFLLEPVNLKQDLTNLLYGYDAKAWMNSDAERLFNLLQAKLGPIALKGALLNPQIWEKISENEWENMLKQFLLY